MGSKSIKHTSPKRSLGQNFFVNKNLAKSIVSLVYENNPDVIIEIGPGTGVFTNLLSQSSYVLAIEKDEQLSIFLKSIFSEESVKVINADIMDLSRENLRNEIPKPNLSNEKIALYGSLPYNQSKRIITQLLSYSISQDHYYIIQKEVAQKYADKVKMNRLNAFSQIFGKSKILKNIGPDSFSPKPNVDSALIHFSTTKKPMVDELQLKDYLEFLNLLFTNPRKKIRSKLKLKNEISDSLKELLSKRSENLEIDEVVQLFWTWKESL